MRPAPRPSSSRPSSSSRAAWRALCDEVWLVTCDPATQRERLLARGTRDEDADRRIAAQDGLVERITPAATRILDSSGDPVVTRALVAAAFAAAAGYGAGLSGSSMTGVADGAAEGEAAGTGEGEADGAGATVIGPEPG